eukprot:scaffold127631_cov24-Phaeocystis_antarctica.AAC.1
MGAVGAVGTVGAAGEQRTCRHACMRVRSGDSARRPTARPPSAPSAAGSGGTALQHAAHGITQQHSARRQWPTVAAGW